MVALSPRPGRAKNLRFVIAFDKAFPIGTKVMLDGAILTVASPALLKSNQVLCKFSELPKYIPINHESVRLYDPLAD